MKNRKGLRRTLLSLLIVSAAFCISTVVLSTYELLKRSNVGNDYSLNEPGRESKDRIVERQPNSNWIAKFCTENQFQNEQIFETLNVQQAHRNSSFAIQRPLLR